MPEKIENYERKKNHDLLVELVIQGNSTVAQGAEIVRHLETLNGSVESNAKCISTLDSQMQERTVPAWMQSPRKVVGYSTLALSIASAVIVLIAEFIKHVT